MGLFQDIRNLFVDDYQDGVRHQSEKPVLFVDPNDFDLEQIKNNFYNGNQTIGPENIKILREVLEEQWPNITNDLTDGELDRFGQTMVDSGPFAISTEHDGQDFCIINEPIESLDHKNEIMPLLANTGKSDLGVIPGWTPHWFKSIGIHEGEHCNKEQVDYSTMTPDEVSAYDLTLETKADLAAVKWLNENGHEQLAQALKDYRALSAANDEIHASSIFLNRDDVDLDNLQVTVEHVEAAENSKDVMFEGVANRLGIREVEAELLLVNDPQKFLDTAREIHCAGGFNADQQITGGNQYVKDYIENYINAYQRQVVDPDPITHGPHKRSTNPAHRFRHTHNPPREDYQCPAPQQEETADGVVQHENLSSVLPENANLTVQSNARNGETQYAQQITAEQQISVVNDSGEVAKLDEIRQQSELQQQAMQQQSTNSSQLGIA